VYNYSYQDDGKIQVITDSLNRSWTTKKNDFGQVYYEEDPAGIILTTITKMAAGT